MHQNNLKSQAGSKTSGFALFDQEFMALNEDLKCTFLEGIILDIFLKPGSSPQLQGGLSRPCNPGSDRSLDLVRYRGI